MPDEPMDDFDEVAADPDLINEIGPDEEEGAEAEEAAPETPAPAAPAPAGEKAPEPWREHLREGETPEQAVERLASEATSQGKRAIAHYHELKDLKTEVSGMRAQLEAANRIYEHFQKATDAQRKREEAAKIPDPELEPERAALYEMQQLKAKIDGLVQGQTEAETKRAEEAKLAEQQGRLAQIDQATNAELLAALGQDGAQPDAKFVEDFNLVERVSWENLKTRYPEATEDQLLQAMHLLRTVEGRAAAVQGGSIRDYYNRTAEALRRAYGAVSASGNGTQTPAGMTAQDIERQADAASRAGGVRRMTGGGSVRPPRTLDEFSRMSEQEQARAIEAGKISEEDIWGRLGEEGYGH